MWKGEISICGPGGGVSGAFVTEIFYKEQVEGLSFEEILFLCLYTNRRLYSIVFRNEEGRKMVVDYMATKILARSFLVHGPFFITTLCFYTDGADRIVISSPIINYMEEVRAGIPGSLAKLAEL